MNDGELRSQIRDATQAIDEAVDARDVSWHNVRTQAREVIALADLAEELERRGLTRP